MFKQRMKTDKAAYLMILPFFLIFTYFYFIPVIKVITDSFTNYDMFTKRDFLGIANYQALLRDAKFKISVMNTFKYTILTLFPSLAIGLGLALLINDTALKTRFSRMFIFMPHVISMVAVSMIWLYLYEPTGGIINTILGWLGLGKEQWLLNPKLAMPCLVVMGIWKSCGYYMIVFLSGLKGIPEHYFEAARIDGASAVYIFRKITLPLLSPTTTFLMITGIISSFNVFEQVNIMTKGGPLNSTTTIVHQIYSAGFMEYKLGYASAMSVVLLIIVAIITAVNFKFSNNDL